MSLKTSEMGTGVHGLPESPGHGPEFSKRPLFPRTSAVRDGKLRRSNQTFTERFVYHIES